MYKLSYKILSNFRFLSKTSSPLRDSIISLLFNKKFNFKSVVEKKEGKIYVKDSFFRLRLSSKERIPIYRFGIHTRLKQLYNDYSLDMVPMNTDDYVVNIGSNIGELAIVIANKGPNVICIEGDSKNIGALKENTSPFNCDVLQTFIWRENEKISFESDINHANSAIEFSNRSSNKAQALTLDSTLNSFNLKNIQLIVGDMEGAEPEMLIGAKQTLKIAKYISLDCGLERDGKTTYKECSKILIDNNWHIIHSFQTGRYNLLAKNKIFE